MQNIMQNVKLEKIRCTLSGFNRFYKTWGSLTTYVNNLPGLELELWQFRPALGQFCNKDC